ncbi:DUF1080 domain-containing protein [Ilyomonas limi]|uniref:DUF1080 domain-containing protein n=1 Tax=Ilyomonas limi TaxID=2575867 RepID=A0A4U3L989_9BACT|nr:DUF1080 domain-containing protein [Ilyomonas limi]TKK71858.1 DUF1080 domain-containing protein [Ilyomonas limi]
MLQKINFKLTLLWVITGLFIATGCNNSEGASSDSNKESADSSSNSDGFVQLFDGKTLAGWKGDTAVWRVEDGTIIGEITPASTPLKTNTFLIWEGGTPSDFELTWEYRISPKGNSGVQYRSEEVQDVPYALRGYQFDIDGANTYTGQNYEERARAIIAFRGQKVTLPAVTEPVNVLAKNNVWSPSVVTDSLGSQDSLKAQIHDGWNSCRIVAKGNHLQHYVNDVLMCDVTDNDTTNRKMKGLLGLQVHVMPTMKVEYRNIRLKEE